MELAIREVPVAGVAKDADIVSREGDDNGPSRFLFSLSMTA